MFRNIFFPFVLIFFAACSTKNLANDTEGVSINIPVLITDEFLLAELSFEEKEAIAPYLFSEEDKRRLANFKEEDNPCLVKLTFKR